MHWVKIIHVAKRQAGLSDEQYRSLLSGAAGVESASLIKSWAQYRAVMAAFKKLGLKSPSKDFQKSSNEDRQPQWISKRQEYYIRGLWRLASRAQSEESLRALTKRITGTDDVTWCSKKSASKLILALRDIAQKAGFNPDSAR